MKLNGKNYFSREANLEFMSVSQFKAFDKCEASALAELKGEWKRETTPAMLVGSLVDSYFEGTFDTFIDEHPEVLRKDGMLKADYQKAEKIVQRIADDPEFMSMLSGDKQVIMTGEIDGVPVKIKMDSYFSGQQIVDLKVMKDFEPIWKEGQKMPWFAAWGYDLQGAVYQEIVFQNTGKRLPFYLAAATKEKETDIQGIHIPQEYLDERLGYFKGMVRRFQDIKDGLTEPEKCGKCDYCKATKKFEIVDASDIYYDME